MTFTKTIPTEPGFYAWRHTPRTGSTAVEIIKDQTIGLWCMATSVDGGMKPSERGGEWCRLVPEGGTQSDVPTPICHNPLVRDMTMRDWIAGQVIAGWMACPKTVARTIGDVVKLAYQYADEVLKQRALGES